MTHISCTPVSLKHVFPACKDYGRESTSEVSLKALDQDWEFRQCSQHCFHPCEWTQKSTSSLIPAIMSYKEPVPAHQEKQSRGGKYTYSGEQSMGLSPFQKETALHSTDRKQRLCLSSRSSWMVKTCWEDGEERCKTFRLEVWPCRVSKPAFTEV